MRTNIMLICATGVNSTTFSRYVSRLVKRYQVYRRTSGLG